MPPARHRRRFGGHGHLCGIEKHDRYGRVAAKKPPPVAIFIAAARAAAYIASRRLHMAVGPQSLSTDQLNAFIVARLAISGVDINLLPTAADPVTGAPTQAQALASLRSFLLSNPEAINSWRPGDGDAAQSQQLDPPLEYPSITEAWTGRVTGQAAGR
ncbi:hypothetical protein [Dactylosporangium darangshiense]|uniref:hypothetical protein n=1 Tax=Dactylosporangium darangshiense TaxID=579108 RepID=UPI0031E855B9